MFVHAVLRNNILLDDEGDLVRKIRAGDASCFEYIFKKHYQSLYRYAYNILKKADESEDLVQQMFVNFWDKREITIITGSLRNYLFRSVHNQCLNVLKHEKVKQGFQNHTMYYNAHYHYTVDQNYDAQELQDKIEEAMELLPTECRRIFRMSREQELKYQEIAEKLELSVKTVENQIGKALKILRQELAEYLISILIILSNL